MAVIAILLVDIYIVILIYALIKHQAANAQDKYWKRLPSKEAAVVVVPLLFLALVFAFGQLYICSGEIKIAEQPLSGFWDAFYFSLVTITTLGYGDFTPTDTGGRFLVIVELLNGMLFLLMAFPVLASRLAERNYKSACPSCSKA